MTESGQDALIAETTGGISAGASVAVSISKLATRNPDAEVTGEVIGRTKDNPNEEYWDVDFHNVAPRTQSLPLGDLILKTPRQRKRKLSDNAEASETSQRPRAGSASNGDPALAFFRDGTSPEPVTNNGQDVRSTSSPQDADEQDMRPSIPSAIRCGRLTWSLCEEAVQDVRDIYTEAFGASARLSWGPLALSSAPSASASEQRSELDYFQLFSWSRATLAEIVQYTNERLEKMQKLRIASVDELQKIFGAIMLRAQHPNLSSKRVWQRIVTARGQQLSAFVSLERFRDVLDCLAFAELGAQDEPTSSTFTTFASEGEIMTYPNCPSLELLVRGFNDQRRQHVTPGSRLSVGVYDPQGKIWARPRFGHRDIDVFLMHDDADTDHSAYGPVPLQMQAATCCASGIIMRVELGTKALIHSSNETFRQTQRLVRPWREKRTLHAQGTVVSLSNATRLWSEDGMYFMGSRPATIAEHIADKDDEGALAICASLEALPLALRGETAMYRTKALLHDVDVLATGWKSPSGKIYSTLSTCGSSAAGKAVAVPASVWTDEKNASDLTEISRDSITAEHLDSINEMRKHDQVRAEIAAFERAFPIRRWRTRLFGALLGMNVVDAYRAHQLESAAPSSFDNFVSQLIEALLTGRPEDGEPADVMMDSRETLDKAGNAGLVPHDQANAASTHVIKGMTQFNREAKIWKQANPKLRCSECKARNRTAAVKTCNFCLTCSLARKGDAPQWISDHVVRLCKDCIPLHYFDGGGSSTLPP